MSEQNAVRKRRGWVIKLVREGCYLAVSGRKKEGEMLSPSWCTQSINVNSLQGSTHTHTHPL